MIEVVLDPTMALVLARFAVFHGAASPTPFGHGIECVRQGRLPPLDRKVTSPQEHLTRLLAEDFEDSIRNPDNHGIMIANGEHGGSNFSIQGLVHYSIRPHSVDIHDLIVHSHGHNRGIGSLLLNELAKLADLLSLPLTAEVNVQQPEVQLWLEHRGYEAVSVNFVRRSSPATKPPGD